MKGIKAYELLEGLDDDLLTEVEDTLGTAAIIRTTPQKRGSRMMSAWAAAAIVCVCALTVYLAVLSLGGGIDKLFHHGAATETSGTAEGTATTADPSETGEAETEGPKTRLPMDALGLFPKNAPEDAAETLVTGVPRPLTIGKYKLLKDAMYFTEEMARFYYGQKINLETGIGSPICADPYCDHSQTMNAVTDPETVCPFNNVGEFCFTYGDKLYYTRSYVLRVMEGRRPKFEYHEVFASYDIYLGTYTELFGSVCSGSSAKYACEAQKLGHVVTYGTYIYALQYVPTDGISDSMEDYRRQLVRIDPADDTVEYLMDVTDLFDPSDSILCIRNGIVVLQSPTAVKTWNPATKFIRELISFDDETAYAGLGDTWVYDDKLYLTLRTYEQDSTGRQVQANRLFRIDLLTGEKEIVYKGFISRALCDGSRAYLILSNLQPDEDLLNFALPYRFSDNWDLRDTRTMISFELSSGTVESVGQIKNSEISSFGLVQYLDWHLENGLLVCGRYEFDMATGIIRDTVSGTVFYDPAAVEEQTEEVSQ